MRREPTKQEILDQMTRLRAEYEQIRRKTLELGRQTSGLYMAIDALPVEGR